MRRVFLSCVFLLILIHTASAGVLFQSSWDYATGYSDEAIFDGGKWYGGSGWSGRLQDPIVYAGGPGGHNFLNMRTVGDDGYGSSYYMGWDISGGTGGDVFQDPDDLYVRLYFRVHDSAVITSPNKHWFKLYSDASHSSGGPSFNFNEAGIFSELEGAPYAIEVGGRFYCNILMETERWYRYELHVQKVDESTERWYPRLDGVDITDKCKAISGDYYGWWLDDFYAAGNSFPNKYYGNIWMTTYDMEGPLNDGWDVAAVEVRDDTWPGPLDVPPTQSCSAQGGTYCSAGQSCNGNWLYADDANYCCDAACSQCNLTDAHWNITSALESEDVELILETENCTNLKNRRVKFEIREDDASGIGNFENADVVSITQSVPKPGYPRDNVAPQVTSNILKMYWVTEWTDDTDGTDPEPEYIFNVRLIENNAVNITSSNELTVTVTQLDCADNDGDSYGEGPDCLGTDCNDNNPNIYPNAPEICDNLDNQCNAEETGYGQVDEGCDDDNDDYCDVEMTYISSDECPLGGNDCNDNNVGINPAAAEICDDSTNLDEDCDGLSNCNDPDCTGNENCPACTSIDITITVDDQYDLYVNGNLIGSEHITDGWKSAETYTADLYEGENVLAVLATDTGGAEGILVDASYCGNKLYSNTFWRTSTTLQSGWENPGFDDSSWESAIDNGAYGVSPWYTNAAGFPTDTDARWIWASSGEEIYARKTFYVGSGAGCTENWVCTAWSSCTDGTQTRSCTDANNCGTTQNKPAEQQSCPIGNEIIVAKDGTGDYTTIQDAIDNVLEGQTILVKNGVYDDLVIYEGEQTVIVRIRGSEHPNNVTLKAYPGHRPIILRDEKPLGGNNRAVVLTGISGWTVEGFEIIGGILDIDHGGSSDIKILNNIIRDVYTHTGDNPGMVRIDAAAGNPMGNNNILIKGNTMHGWSCDQPQYSTDCDPPHMGGVAILSQDDYDYDISYEQSTRDIIIEDNEMYDLPKAFFFKNSATGPYIIRNNYFHDLDGIASVSNREMEFYNNLVVNVYPGHYHGSIQTSEMGGGFKMEPGRSVPIDYEAWGVGLPNIYNNTFVNFYQLHNLRKMFNSHTNNLVFRTKELSDSMSDKWANVLSFDLEVRCQTNYAELSQATVNNNCYVLNEPRSTYRFVNGRWQTPSYYTFDDARSALGIEQDSIFIESATAEEVFENIVDPTPGDHRLPENFLKLKDTFTQCGNIKGANFDYSSWGGQPLLQCLVNLSDCSISMIGGKINSCSLQQLQYEYDATESVQNNVSGLQPNTIYNIKIQNLTQGTEQNISANSNSAGVLQFSS